MKKALLILLLEIFITSSFSQINFQEEPKEYKKIHFVYEQKSNYYIDERGVFADTLLFQVDFPKLKYTKITSPNDSTFVCGFISLKDFDSQEKKKLSAILYHGNQKLEGEYNLKTNTTIIKVERNNPVTREVFKKHLKTSYLNFEYTITINYNLKTIFIKYPLVEYLKEFKNEFKKIVYDSDKLSGTFKEEREDFIFENKVFLNAKLNNKIVPGQVFTNNSSGVEKIISVYNTFNLLSYSYK